MSQNVVVAIKRYCIKTYLKVNGVAQHIKNFIVKTLSMVRIDLHLSGKELEKLGAIIHEQVDNEITLCGENIHKYVKRHKVTGDNYQAHNLGIRTGDYSYSPQEIVTLEISSRNFELEDLVELIKE